MRHTNKNAKLVSKTSAFQLHQQEISSFKIQVLAQKQRCLLFLERGSSDWQRFLHPHSPRTYLCCTGRCHHGLTWGYKRQDGGRGCTRHWWVTEIANLLQVLRTYFSNAFLQHHWRWLTPGGQPGAQREALEVWWPYKVAEASCSVKTGPGIREQGRVLLAQLAAVSLETAIKTQKKTVLDCCVFTNL